MVSKGSGALRRSGPFALRARAAKPLLAFPHPLSVKLDGADCGALTGIAMGGGRDNGNSGRGPGQGAGTGVVTKTRPKTKKPSLYKVLLLNDDYTPMEFVVHILERFFNKGRDEAVQIMLHVHRHGVGICGVFTYEVAETKVAQVIEFARRHQHPLQCTMEKE
jgi:ATP-dependent Clp protease adaptor protein ClpS